MPAKLVRTIGYLLLLTVIYLLLTLFAPISLYNPQLYHFSNSSAHVLQFVLALPLVVTWLAAFYGYVKLKEYSRVLKNSEEASGYSLLARGCMWLAWSKPILGIVGLLLDSLAHHHNNLLPATTIVLNYADIIVLVIAFSIIATGTKRLLDQAKLQLSPSIVRIMVLIFIALSVVYCYFMFRPVSLISMSYSSSPYYLPVWLVITTITLPSLYAWLIGLIAVGDFIRYSQKTHGLIYKQAVKLISIGMIAIIASAIALQYATSIDPAIKKASLDYLLISNYLIKLLGALGFLSIAAGAIRLKRIEEV